MENAVQTFYGNRLRVRACGICIQDNAILLVNHRGLSSGNLWAPPGGGIQFGETAADCLVREFNEEAGLIVKIERFLFACEFISTPLHAVELFFEVTPLTNELKLGTDPEPGSPDILSEVKFMHWREIIQLPTSQRHGIFNYVDHLSMITTLCGYFRV